MCVSYIGCNIANVAEFLCITADTSSKPKSVLKTTHAALQHLFRAVDRTDLLNNSDISNLLMSLVKSGSSVGMTRSSVMPVDKFKDLFIKWECNEHLSVANLRLKTITLLALILMLRPSDIAPKGVLFNPISKDSETLIFNTNNGSFNSDGSLSVTLLGTKNDSSRAGFQVHVQPASNKKLDPVCALKCYMDRTDKFRSINGPVFLTLYKPYRGIDASTVAKILNDAIVLAGLSKDQFSAKSFRPTGATRAVEQNFDPDLVMQTGRWKTRSVFFEHYVHAKPPTSYTDCIIDIA